MKKQEIILLLADHFDEDFALRLSKKINHEFYYPVVVKSYDFNMSDYYYPGRRQYDANKLLKSVSEILIPGAFKTMALFKVDLFIPILTFIFGQAILNGHAGLISLYRLRNELYGLQNDEKLLEDRLVKVINHEIGHTFGLIHCQNIGCVMRSSTYVEHLDQKSHHLCFNCKKKVLDQIPEIDPLHKKQ